MKLDLARLGLGLRRDAGDLLLELRDALLELGLLSEPCGAPELEQPLLGRHHASDVGISRRVREGGGEGDGIQRIPLGRRDGPGVSGARRGPG